VAILVTDAPAKCAPTICPLKIWQVSHFAVLSYKLFLNTICNALTLTLHSVFFLSFSPWLVGSSPFGIAASRSFQCCITISSCVFGELL
jgi:hypothetical protein